MKRFAIVASVFVFAACSPKAEEAAPATETVAPAAMDSAMTDSTKTDSMKMDTTAAAHYVAFGGW